MRVRSFARAFRSTRRPVPSRPRSTSPTPTAIFTPAGTSPSRSLIDRKQVWTLPSNAIGFQGGQNYFVYFEVDGKPVRTPVIIGPSDDTHTEIIKKFVPNANTNDWPDLRRDRKDPRRQHGRTGRRCGSDDWCDVPGTITGGIRSGTSAGVP